jgi:Ca-activated chloride channel family protein
LRLLHRKGTAEAKELALDGRAPDIAAKIGSELRNQYILGYRLINKAHDARWRKMKIKLRTPKGLPPLTAYAKTGYYAPSH